MTETISSIGHCENWSKWLGHLAGQPAKGLEVGSHEGKSAIWFLENILNHPESSITCVDTWKGGEDLPQVYDDLMWKTFLKNTASFGNKINCIRNRSENVLPTLPSDHFDFAYIDGSHTAASVLSDSVLTWILVKSGGVVMWDDYLWELPRDPVKQPRMAIDSFLACNHGRYTIISHGWQVAVKKIT